jgi:hypothetical protein
MNVENFEVFPKKVDPSSDGQALVPLPLYEKALPGKIDGSLAPLLNHDDSENLRKRWIEIQGKFVDEPREAVQQADTLVSEVLKQVIQVFASEHSTLESQWNQGSNVSTEDLRKALQHYRSFFNRLVV